MPDNPTGGPLSRPRRRLPLHAGIFTSAVAVAVWLGLTAPQTSPVAPPAVPVVVVAPAPAAAPAPTPAEPARPLRRRR